MSNHAIISCSALGLVALTVKSSGHVSIGGVVSSAVIIDPHSISVLHEFVILNITCKVSRQVSPITSEELKLGVITGRLVPSKSVPSARDIQSSINDTLSESPHSITIASGQVTTAELSDLIVSTALQSSVSPHSSCAVKVTTLSNEPKQISIV